MEVLKTSTVPVASSNDIVQIRQMTRAWSVEQGFNLVDQTKLVTAASELARNTVNYGGGGTVDLELLRDGLRRGVRLTFLDNGPGIPDIALALSDGYTTGSGMGLGLGGARRLVDEFAIESGIEKGTRVVIAKWK